LDEERQFCSHEFITILGIGQDFSQKWCNRVHEILELLQTNKSVLSVGYSSRKLLLHKRAVILLFSCKKFCLNRVLLQALLQLG